MYFIILATDKADSLALRMENRPAHLDYVRECGKVVLAGPFLSQGDNPAPRGSMLIIEAAGRQEAEEFAARDPYALAGLFQQVEIHPWKPALGQWLPEET